jgi:hypothetical protein
MPSPRVHIIATEARTLCGLLVDNRRSWLASWPDWLRQYQSDPLPCCPRCRRVCLRYTERVRAIRVADLARAEHLDNLDQDPSHE